MTLALSIGPPALNFGSTLNALSLDIRNGGTGSLRIEVLDPGAASWLRVWAEPVGDPGLGRGGVAEQTYGAQSTVHRVGQSQAVAVIMQVRAAAVEVDDGSECVPLVLDGLEPRIARQAAAFNAAGKAADRFAGIDGDYVIVASSDQDYNEFYCGWSESCGDGCPWCCIGPRPDAAQGRTGAGPGPAAQRPGPAWAQAASRAAAFMVSAKMP